MRYLLILLLFLAACQEPVPVPVRYYSVEQGMPEALKTNKPVLVYYSAYADINSRKLEDRVFTDPEINSLLQSFVIVQLMVDDRAGIPDSMMTETGMNYMGDWYAELMMQDLNTISTPGFAVYDGYGHRLDAVVPLNYISAYDKAALKKFLEDGITSVNSWKPGANEPVRLKNVPVKNGTTEKFQPIDTNLADIATGFSADQKIKWEYKLTRINDQEAMLEMHGVSQGKLRFYSFNQSSGDAPKSAIVFIKSANWSADGLPLEMKVKTIYEETMQTQLTFSEGETTVKQKIKLKGNGPFQISGTNHFFYGDSEWISSGESEFRLLLK